MSSRMHRRRFLAGTAGAGAGLLILPSARSALGYQANERLNLGVVGVAGYGAHHGFVTAIHLYDNVTITALCDVDARKTAPTFAMWEERAREWPGADDAARRRGAEHYIRLVKNRPPMFEDFRRMFDQASDRFDAAVVATPDHTHAVISAAALRAGKHVLAEKPLTISAHEGRALRKLTLEQQVATTVNTGGAASAQFRRGVEIVRDGVLGPVEQVHVFFSRGGRNFQNTPEGAHDVPPELNWNLWLAQLPWRDYHPGWINRIAWRGTSLGELGNFGPHSANMAFMSLEVKDLWDRRPEDAARKPIRIRAECSEINRVSYPRSERIRWEVPARGDLPPVALTWHHGYPPDYAPGSRELLTDLLRDHGASQEEIKELLGYAGAVLVGSKGILVTNSHNTTFTLFPKDRFEEVQQRQPQTIPTSPGHYREWIDACRGGPMPLTNFEYAAPFAELLTLGEIATRFAGESLDYDPVAGRMLNHVEANQALSYEYREGWRL
jgi:predicted dehydrogenase